MHITAVDMVSRQITIAVRRPGEIDGAGSRIGHGHQPLGNRGRENVGGRNHDGVARHALYLNGFSGDSQGRHPFERVAIALVEQGGAVDRVTRVFAVLAMDHEGLCGSRSGRRERNSGASLGAGPSNCRRSMR